MIEFIWFLPIYRMLKSKLDISLSLYTALKLSQTVLQSNNHCRDTPFRASSDDLSERLFNLFHSPMHIYCRPGGRTSPTPTYLRSASFFPPNVHVSVIGRCCSRRSRLHNDTTAVRSIEHTAFSITDKRSRGPRAREKMRRRCGSVLVENRAQRRNLNTYRPLGVHARARVCTLWRVEVR